MNREPLTPENLGAVIKIREKMVFRAEQKGLGAYASRHETLGIIIEEIHELTEAVQSESLERVSEELLDIAVACVFGMASIDSDKTDW